MDWSSPAVWAGLLASLRAGTTDLALRPERWETRAPIAIVEDVLRDPLTGPGASDKLEMRLASAKGSAGLIMAGFETLGVKAAPPDIKIVPVPAPQLPASLRLPVETLVARLAAARVELNRAVDAVPEGTKAAALAAVEAAVGDDGFARARGEDFDAALTVDLESIGRAGVMAAAAVDDALPALEAAARSVPAGLDAAFDSPIGRVLVSAGEKTFDAAELRGAGLILRLGGATRYAGPAAAAGPGEMRVVVDLGGPATLAADGSAGGSADFGVGLLYLLGPGPHKLRTGPRSLGAARFGVAYARVDGDGSAMASERFSQGAAAFGAGVLETRGTDLILTAPLAAQAYGSTLGAGVWRHAGGGLTASCGFELADPRESLAFMSLGQGAGMGPRAFAAGGVGAAHLTGDDIRLAGSYFAQGAGYWRGLGALYVRGDRARLQARRYSLGTGVHAAVGTLDIKGRDARVETWGVGPGFGWDYGVGLFRLRGDKARIRSDWATGRADLGSRSLSWIEGDGHELSLDSYGTGSYTRAQAGYGLAVIKGRGARLRQNGLPSPVRGEFELASTPWGALRAEGELSLDPALTLPEPVWPKPDPSEIDRRAREEKGRADRLLAPDPGETPTERVRRLLFAASAQILDQRPAETSARSLASLSAADAAALAAALDPDRFDELVWARLAAAALGPAAAKAGALEARRAKALRRASLLEWIRFGRAAEALPEAEKWLKDPDWRVRRAATGSIGGLFANDLGDEPGRRRLLRTAVLPGAKAADLGMKRLADLYMALALAGPPAPELRLKLLSVARSPFDNTAAEAKELFLATVASSPAAVAALEREERDLARLLPRARALLRAAAQDADDEVASAALVSLGAAGDAGDAAFLAGSLSAPTASRREAGAAGLARMGTAAEPALGRALSASEPRARALAAIAAAQSWDPAVFGLVRRALGDADAFVRRAAISGLSWTPQLRGEEKKSLAPELRKLASDDPDANVRASAAVALASIAPAK